MGTRRTLIHRLALLAALTVGLSRGHAHESPQSRKTSLPRWVRLSLFADKAVGIEYTAGKLLAGNPIERPSETLKNTADVVTYARSVYLSRGRLLTGKQRPTSRTFGKTFVALEAGEMLWEYQNGRLTGEQAAKNLVQLGVSGVASTLATGGMIWFAGSVGTASTGVAISSLSGAAYTSAATAWWGGGAVSAGGGGMAWGSMVITGGAVVAVVATGVVVYKVWNMLDPAERDALRMTAERLQASDDLVDATTPYGAALVAEARRLEVLSKKLKSRLPTR